MFTPHVTFLHSFRKCEPLPIKHYETNMQNEHNFITYKVKETPYTR